MTVSAAGPTDQPTATEPPEDTHRLDAPPQTLDGDPPASSLMSDHVVGIVPDAPAQTALHLMARANVRHLPVIDGTNCVGMLLESDVLSWLSESRGSPFTAPVEWVSHICRRPPITVPLDSRRSEVTTRMVIGEMDAVLVADNGRIVGIITATDLVRSLAKQHPAPSTDVSVKLSP